MNSVDCITCCKPTYTLVECPSCQYKCCQKCVQQYLLKNVKDVVGKCMNCGVGWNDEFLSHLGKTFYSKTWPTKVSKILMEREKTRLLEMQEPARCLKKVVEINTKMAEMEKEKMELMRIYRAYMSTGQPPEGAVEEKKKREKVGYHGKCPQEDCRGILNSKGVCGLCEKKACRKCNKIEHEGKCNEDDLETAKLLKKQTKPCPECKVPIFKISGCDQMFCTSCHTAFSWSTGKLEQGRLHNPHFYQWLRRISPDGNIPREEEKVECNQLIGFASCRRVFSQLHLYQNSLIMGTLPNIIQRVLHLYNDVRPNNNRKMEGQEEKKRELRVSYLNNNLEEKKWMSEIKRMEKERKMLTTYNQLVEMAYNTATIIINRMYNQAVATKTDDESVQMFWLTEGLPAFQKLDKLREYYNDCVWDLQKRFNTTRFSFYDTNWNWMSPGRMKAVKAVKGKK